MNSACSSREREVEPIIDENVRHRGSAALLCAAKSQGFAGQPGDFSGGQIFLANLDPIDSCGNQRLDFRARATCESAEVAEGKLRRSVT